MRTTTTAVSFSDAEAQWCPVFATAGNHVLAGADLPDPKGKKPDHKSLGGKSLGAAVFVFEGFKDADRDANFNLKHKASTSAKGLTAANVWSVLQGDTTHFPSGAMTVANLDTWFGVLSGEGYASSKGKNVVHNTKGSYGAYDASNSHAVVNKAPVTTALFNALWDLYGTPLAHWGIAVARYRFTGRHNLKYDVYWIGGVDNTAYGTGGDDSKLTVKVAHTEYRLLEQLKDFEDSFLLASKVVDAELAAPVLPKAFTERHINWALLFFPCGDGNRGCDYHIAHFDGGKPKAKNGLTNSAPTVDSQCPATATSHVVWFKDPATDNKVVQPQ